ncbi:fungal-specific transcription factor domain-containing protein [Russula vinacea]|nr:fungal-specific transcription factor domain-containing protein [Russula vinacea]
MRELSVSTASPEGALQVAESTSRPKLKRNRIILSCQQCHKRKQQASRLFETSIVSTPHDDFCSVIVAILALDGTRCLFPMLFHSQGFCFASTSVNRGCADACTYEEPKEVKKRRIPEPESTNAPDLGQINGSNSADSNVLIGLDALLQVLQSANASSVVSTPPPDSFDSSRSSAHVSENSVQVAATALNQLSQQEAPDHYPFAGMILSFRGFGNPTTPFEHQRHFPNQKITTFLLSYYFDRSSVHWIFPIIHRPCFENYYRTCSSGQLPPTVEFIALLAITCATALQFLPETDDDVTLFADYAAGRKVLQQHLVDFSRSVLFSCTDYPLSSLERIQALALFSIYQWNEANSGESWYIITLAIRMAQTLSLNRDGTTTWRMQPEEAEVRRRLWWTLFTIDRFHCMEYRRPYIISDQHTDVALPMNLDQADVVNIPGLTGKPMEEPTEYSYHLYHCQLRKLSGHLWDQCFSTALPTYRVVMDLEEQIMQFELELPSSFRYQTTQMAVARPYLSFQYHSMTLDIIHHRMQLLRPFLFVHPTKEEEFESLSVQDKKLSTFHKHARSICVTLCKRLLAAMQLLQSSAEPGHLAWSGMSLLTFKSALSIAIAIIMDAQNPENEELEEWIAMAQGILAVLKPHNVLAQKALDHLQVIRKRTLFVLGVVTGRCVRSDPVVHGTADIAPSMSLPQRLDRMTRTLTQSLPSLVDLLGSEAMDPFWSTLHPGVFAGHFPGIESLVGPVSPQNLEQFLDSCLSMHSRLPHTFTF